MATGSAEEQVCHWLQRVHPGCDNVVVMHQAAGEKAAPVRHKTVLIEEPAHLAKAAQLVVDLDSGRRSGTPQNVWIATASYLSSLPSEQRHRIAGKITGIKAFWADVDIDPNDSRHYPTRREAFTCFARIVQRSPYPFPNLIVLSGNGFHFYWCLTKALHLDEWRAAATALQTSLRDAKLKFDHAVTIDPVRVLRPPGTSNRKDKANPRPVELIYETEGDLAPELFLRRIAANGAAGLGSLDPAMVPDYLKGQADPVAEAAGQLPQRSYEPYRMAELVEHCLILKKVATDHGAACNEPEWRAVLQVCSFAGDGLDWVHPLSDGHAEYDPIATDRKYASIAQGKHRYGPHTCKFLEQQFEVPVQRSPCHGCAFMGRIKSPASIPQARRWIGVPYWQNIIDPPRGPAIYYHGEEQEKPDKMASFAIERLELIHDEHGEKAVSTLRFQAVRAGGGRRSVDLDLTTIHDPRSMSMHIARQGLTSIVPAHQGRFYMGLQTMRDDLLRRQMTLSDIRTMGWGTDQAAPIFVLGHHVYDGTIGRRPGVTRITGNLGAIQAHYTPRGTLDGWRKIVEPLTHDQRPEAHAALACAFAAPLVRFTGFHGLITAFISPHSGVGKTTYLRVAQSVWGHPSEMHMVSDTHNSLLLKLGLLNSIPLVKDEIRNDQRSEEDALRALFQFEGGSEKSRMSSAGGMQARGSWASMMLMASNHSLQSMMEQHGFGEPGVARILEIEIQPLDAANELLTASDLIDLEAHYGVAGEQLVQTILIQEPTVRQAIKKLIIDLRQRFQVSHHAGQEGRYLFANGACIMAGAYIARAAEILPSLDVAKVATVIVEAIGRSLSVIRRVKITSSPIELLRNYLHEHGPHTVFTDRTKPVQPGSSNLVSQPRNERAALVAEIDIGFDRVFFRAPHFRTWLKAKSLDGERCIRELTQAHGAKRQRGRLAPNSPFASPDSELVMINRAAVGI